MNPQPESAFARERLAERLRMVETQLASPTDGRAPVVSGRVLEAMRRVPRHAMVPEDVRQGAYEDMPLPIGHGQTISQPYIVGIMTQLLELPPEGKVLEIGTGSGYQAAVLAHLTPHVYSIETVEALFLRTRVLLPELGYGGVHLRLGDGHQGWAEEAPFDGIVVTCAPGEVPPALWEQIRTGGRIVAPVGGAHALQRLLVITKSAPGVRRTETVMPVRFVPMVRRDATGN